MAYATVSELKRYLNIAADNTQDDGLLADLLARAEMTVNRYCGRIFATSVNTTRKFYEDAVNGPFLQFDDDLCELVSVIDGDGSVLDGSQYELQPINFVPHFGIWRKTGRWHVGIYQPIAITGKWAYSLQPPDDIVHATIRLAAYFYRQRDAQVFDVTASPELGVLTIPRGFPADVEKILRPYKKLRIR